MNNLERLKEKLRNAASATEKKEPITTINSIDIQNVPSGNENFNEENFILKQKMIELDIMKVESNPFQPRTKFEKIDDLADNIYEHGLLQPITVYYNDADDKYFLIAGERRLRAIKLLKERGDIDSTIYRVNLVENLLSDEDKKILATLENTHRDNMTIIDIANNAASYVNSGMSYSDVGKLFNIGKTVVSRYMKIAKLPSSVQNILNTSEVKSPNKIELLSEISNIDKQIEFAQYILEDISITQLETKIKKYLKSIKENSDKKILIETPFDRVKPVSKILSKARYRKLTESEKTKADEILDEIYKLQLKLHEITQ